MGQHELDKNAYVGVDEMYQNAASHTEYPMNTEAEQAAIDANRAALEITEPDSAEVGYAEIEEDEELDGDVEDDVVPPGADNGFAVENGERPEGSEPGEQIVTTPEGDLLVPPAL